MTVAQLKVREPLGERVVVAPVAVGSGPEAAVQLPVGGVDGAADSSGEAAAGISFWLEPRGGVWFARPHTAASGRVRLNGERLAAERELRSGDVLAAGDARCVLELDRDGGALLDVHHLAGNATLPPLRRTDSRLESQDSSDAEIVAALVDLAAGGSATAGDAGSGAFERPGARSASRKTAWVGGLLAATLAAFAFGVLARLERVPVDVLPGDARVSVDAMLSWYTRGTLFVLPGQRVLHAERAGYVALQRPLEVRAGDARTQPVKLRLALEPGVLTIDTGGVPATVTVDGIAAGQAPGDLKIAAGSRTVTLRAERYLDSVNAVKMEGAGRRQELAVKLQTSWGRLAVSASTPGAVLEVEGRVGTTTLPATIDLAAGLQKVRVRAPSARTWESSVLVKAGETLTLGPLDLGAPDAMLAITSSPRGASVSVAGVYRGRTPLELPLPPGADYDLMLTLPGYGTWTRRIAAQAGTRQQLTATLPPILVDLSITGEPADAEVFVNGESRGRAPAQLRLIATRHRLEVRRAGLQAFSADVDLTAALARRVEYTLVKEGRPANWTPPTERWSGKLGHEMRLMQPGSFTMGSERREQGRRPNEVARTVTLTRPFYLGLREITNGEFRRFRPNHSSGFADKRTLDLDGQALSGVAWVDAVAYCNWASEQEGLVPAYEQKNGQWSLKEPVTTGYRLPTEAEWEFAARNAGGAAGRRYAWGDALPPPPRSANLAGSEATGIVTRTLDGWADDYISVAPPGKFAPNPVGLFDLVGNVSEWVNDTYVSLPPGSAATDPLGPPAAARRVVKGANWRTASFAELRLAWRDGLDTPTQDVGFRIARYAE